jgi:CRISPR system Cascade subunit CasE
MATLYLSRLIPNPLKREVQRDLADCHNLHRRILLAFPDTPEVERAREAYGALYRVDRGRDGLMVLVQSRAAPDWSRLPAGYLTRPAEVKRIDPNYDQLRPGTELRFRLRANPTRRISARNTTQGEHWRGKRVDLRREEDQLAWLRRKGEVAGFSILAVRARPEVSDVRAMPGTAVHGRRQGTGQLTFGAVTLEGRLRVTDIERFRLALETGIGNGKAYGFGLLSIAPVVPPRAPDN